MRPGVIAAAVVIVSCGLLHLLDRHVARKVAERERQLDEYLAAARRGLGTWHCDICFIERPDAAISVATFGLKGWPGMDRNVKYCNDREPCRKAAAEWAETGRMRRPQP